MAGCATAPGNVRVTLAEYNAEGGLRFWQAIMLSYPPCLPPVAAAPDPEAVVIDVLERFPLPAPEPSIAPGRAITGLRAYLEPNLDAPVEAGRTTWRGTRSTVLGEVAIVGVGRYVVDWGDEVTGPHTGPGGPYPNGNISHVWTTMGTYDVGVTVEWDVAWRMGSATGSLTAATQGTIADFPVNQVQAVLHY